MKLSLSKEAIAALPEPASDGVIRATAGLKLSPEGEVTLVEINDVPVNGASDDDDDSSDAPNLGTMASELYGPQRT